MVSRSQEAKALGIGMGEPFHHVKDEYIPNESMADGLYFGEPKDVAGAIAIFEAWLERHPDHAMARRRLTNISQ